MGFLNYDGLNRLWSKLKTILSRKIDGDGVSKIRFLTQEEYEALPNNVKNDGTIYVTDMGITPITDEQIEALFEVTET